MKIIKKLKYLSTHFAVGLRKRILNFVHKMDTTKVCRLCGKDAGKNWYKIFDKDGSGKQILQLIKQCIPILVSNSL